MPNSAPSRLRQSRALREFWFPMLLQFAALFFAIWLHGRFIGLGGLLQPAVERGGELSSPTAGRFGYMLFALCAGIALAALAGRASQTGNDRRGARKFWLSVASGTLLWQAIGEDAKHFGAAVDGEFIPFANLEGSAVLFILIGFAALLLLMRRAPVPHGLRAAALCFFFNWLGHFAMLGAYPIAAAQLSPRAWALLAGCALGAALSALGLRAGLRRDASAADRRIASLIACFGVGFIAMAFMEG